MKQILLVALAVGALTGCKKDKDEDPIAETPMTPDCEVKNYGTVKVTFGATTIRHSIIITKAGESTFREKISNPGLASDTLHLTPASYTLSISSINDAGAAVDSDTKSVLTSQCYEINTSVTF